LLIILMVSQQMDGIKGARYEILGNDKDKQTAVVDGFC